MAPVYAKYQIGCFCQRRGKFLQSVRVLLKPGAEKHKNPCRQQIVVEHISAVHGKGDPSGRRLGQIAQQTGSVTCQAPQVDQHAGSFGKLRAAQQVSQQEIPYVALQQGVKQMDINREDMIQDGPQCGWK